MKKQIKILGETLKGNAPEKSKNSSEEFTTLQQENIKLKHRIAILKRVSLLNKLYIQSFCFLNMIIIPHLLFRILLIVICDLLFHTLSQENIKINFIDIKHCYNEYFTQISLIRTTSLDLSYN